MKMYDAIIIGGGPTGSTAATFMAEKGLSVLVLEKEKFPREHVGESLIPLTFSAMQRMGLLEDLKKISTRKPGVVFVSADGKSQSLWCFKNIIKDEGYLSFHVIRSAFDKLLLDNSKKKGADVREEHMVKDIVLDKPDGTVEVTAMTAGGSMEKFSAKFLVDASGQSTMLGRKLGVKKSYKDLERVAIFNHWTNVKYDQSLKEGVIKIVYLGGEKKGWCWVIPVSTEHLSIGVVLSNSHVREQKEKYVKEGKENWEKEIYLNELKESSLLGGILKDAKLEHRTLIIGDYSYYCEKKYGDNYAMIGDAGAFLDPIFSSGIYVGMESAEMLAGALENKFLGKGDMTLEKMYTKINGAVNLLEKFIRLFYTPEALNFSTMGDPDQLLYHKFEMAYTIFHYLLAGDFFENYEKYSQFIDMIRDEKALNKFQHLIKHQKDDNPNSSCGEKFEEMYGEMTHQISFDKSIM
ncbi:MAG: NAD(P)/FAD-dependent oxidoreductase [Bacteroidia bacterium]